MNLKSFWNTRPAKIAKEVELGTSLNPSLPLDAFAGWWLPCGLKL